QCKLYAEYIFLMGLLAEFHEITPQLRILSDFRFKRGVRSNLQQVLHYYVPCCRFGRVLPRVTERLT
ncbi:MAG TPA: hypothetical protein PKD72_12055, partial [Gemmatales bacterium]|nr:hypothetical protein [Gemmatales bacterium]